MTVHNKTHSKAPHYTTVSRVIRYRYNVYLTMTTWRIPGAYLLLSCLLINSWFRCLSPLPSCHPEASPSPVAAATHYVQPWQLLFFFRRLALPPCPGWVICKQTADSQFPSRCIMYSQCWQPSCSPPAYLTTLLLTVSMNLNPCRLNAV